MVEMTEIRGPNQGLASIGHKMRPFVPKHLLVLQEVVIMLSVKTKDHLRSTKTLLITVLSTALALPALHSSSLTSESLDQLDLFGSTSNSQWFSQFGNFQSSYSGFFSFSAFSLPRSAGDVLANSPVVGPMTSLANSAPVSASPVQLVALSSGAVSTAATSTAPAATSQSTVTVSDEPVFRTFSVPAETAADGGSTMQPRTIVITPPTPSNKPIFSNL